MIHAHASLSNIQKLNYLRLSVSGRAATSIEAFTISEDNYEPAWNHLTEIFDNKHAIILRHAALLRETPVMQNDSSDAILDLVNHVQLHVRSLRALGRTWEDLANDLLAGIIISRMSTETRKNWEQTLTDREMPKIHDIFNHLHNAAHQSNEYESDAQIDKPSVANNSTRSVAKNRDNQSVRTTRYRNSSPSSAKVANHHKVFVTKTRISNCSICKGEQHRTYQCKTFQDMSIDKRIEAVRNAKLCINCLLPGHSVGTCNLGGCNICNLKHNTRLHKPANSNTERVGSHSENQSDQTQS